MDSGSRCSRIKGNRANSKLYTLVDHGRSIPTRNALQMWLFRNDWGFVILNRPGFDGGSAVKFYLALPKRRS